MKQKLLINFLTFSRGVGPACLPYAYKFFAVPTGTQFTAIGWGATEFSLGAIADPKSWILQKVTLFSNQNLGACTIDETKLCLKGSWNSATSQRLDTCQRGLYF